MFPSSPFVENSIYTIIRYSVLEGALQVSGPLAPVWYGMYPEVPTHPVEE